MPAVNFLAFRTPRDTTGGNAGPKQVSIHADTVLPPVYDSETLSHVCFLRQRCVGELYKNNLTREETFPYVPGSIYSPFATNLELWAARKTRNAVQCIALIEYRIA